VAGEIPSSRERERSETTTQTFARRERAHEAAFGNREVLDEAFSALQGSFVLPG
jgi:hypothetical protein